MSNLYKANSAGFDRYKKVRKDFIIGLIIQPVVYAIIIILVYFSIWTKSHLYFCFMIGFIAVWITISWYATIRLIKRQSKTILGIDFLGEEIVFKLDKILWIESLEYRLLKSKIKLDNKKFGWYGQETEKEGLLIRSDNIELFLVRDYFDSYDDILKQLIEKE